MWPCSSKAVSGVAGVYYLPTLNPPACESVEWPQGQSLSRSPAEVNSILSLAHRCCARIRKEDTVRSASESEIASVSEV